MPDKLLDDRRVCKPLGTWGKLAIRSEAILASKWPRQPANTIGILGESAY